MPLSDDRYTEILRGVFERTDEEAPVAPTWSAIPKRVAHSASGWRGPLVALGVAAAAVLLVAVPNLYIGQGETTRAPVGATDTEGAIVLAFLTDDVADAQLDAAIETLTTDPLVIEWRFVDKETARAEALVQFADNESIVAALDENPDIIPASIRLLAANVTDATALASTAAELPGMAGFQLGWGTLATTFAIAMTEAEPFDEIEVYEIVDTTTSTLAAADNAIACPVTIPPQPGFSPPDGYPSTPVSGVWYGTEGLWTAIEVDGIANPRKTVLWSVNFGGGAVEERPEVDVTWTRIDVRGEQMSNGGEATNAYTPQDGDFMIAGLDPDDRGCWEVTATYKGATLTYVYAVPAESAIPQTADPLFEDESPWVLLFDNGPNAVLAIDPNNPVGIRTDVYGDRPGDQLNAMTRVGDHFVVGWGIIYASSFVSGESTPLGAATMYIPASESDRVWLIDWAGGEIGSGPATAWQVNMTGERLTDPEVLDIDGFPRLGIPGGLAVGTDTGIRLWYPESGATETTFGSGTAMVQDVWNSLLAYCPSTPCNQVRIVDLENTLFVTVLDGTGFHHATSGSRIAQFSPDGATIALSTDQGLFLADTRTGRSTPVGNKEAPADGAVSISWAPDGSQVFATTRSSGTPEITIERFDLESGTLDRALLPVGSGIHFLVLDRTDAALYLNTKP